MSEHALAAESPNPPAAQVTVKGAGVEVTRSVDETTMSKVIALLFGTTPDPAGRGGRRSSGGGSGSGSGGEIGDKGGDASGGGAGGGDRWDNDLTLGEFITETGASTFQHKICAAGYYLMNFNSEPSFSRDDVKKALADAHEDMPGNYGRDFTAAASKNLIASKTGDSGQYIVPRTGKRAVESHFQDVPKARARRTAKKAASKGDVE